MTGSANSSQPDCERCGKAKATHTALLVPTHTEEEAIVGLMTARACEPCAKLPLTEWVDFIARKKCEQAE